MHHPARQRHGALEGLAVALVQRDLQAAVAQGEQDGVDGDEGVGKVHGRFHRIGFGARCHYDARRSIRRSDRTFGGDRGQRPATRIEGTRIIKNSLKLTLVNGK
ncbi:hypothetical protein D3C72_2053600 [compost metagenome]